MANTTLQAAKAAKNDEFYTTKQTIEAELGANLSYRKSFEGKTVLMNCDDPEWSEFWKFFVRYFHVFKLKKIISTHYNMDGSPSYKLEWDGTMVGGNAVNMIKPRWREMAILQVLNVWLCWITDERSCVWKTIRSSSFTLIDPKMRSLKLQ